MKRWRWVGALVAAGVIGCSRPGPVPEHEREIPLAEVPEAVRKAAQGAVEGIQLTEAELEQEGGRILYEVEGTANGKEYEIELTADGQILEIEVEDENDD